MISNIRRPRPTQGGARQGIRHFPADHLEACNSNSNSSSSSTLLCHGVFPSGTYVFAAASGRSSWQAAAEQPAVKKQVAGSQLSAARTQQTATATAAAAVLFFGCKLWEPSGQQQAAAGSGRQPAKRWCFAVSDVFRKGCLAVCFLLWRLFDCSSSTAAPQQQQQLAAAPAAGSSREQQGAAGSSREPQAAAGRQAAGSSRQQQAAADTSRHQQRQQQGAAGRQQQAAAGSSRQQQTPAEAAAGSSWRAINQPSEPWCFAAGSCFFPWCFPIWGPDVKVAKIHGSSKRKKEPKASFSMGFRSHVRHFRGTILGLLRPSEPWCFAAGSCFFPWCFPIWGPDVKVAKIHGSSKRKKEPKASFSMGFRSRVRHFRGTILGLLRPSEPWCFGCRELLFSMVFSYLGTGCKGS